MIGPKKNDKKVSDDFYDRINYYEARNIFSSNEPVNPNNRLYTNYANNTHSVWESIKKPNVISSNNENNENIENEKMNVFGNLICPICGFAGHLPYQCRNKMTLKKKKKGIFFYFFFT